MSTIVFARCSKKKIVTFKIKEFFENYYNFLNENPIFFTAIKYFLVAILIYMGMKFIQSKLIKLIKFEHSTYKIKQITNFTFIFVLIVLALGFESSISRNIGVILGFSAAGLAFALQEIIASFAGWFVIIVARNYSVGDRIEMSGIVGDVIHVGFLSTSIMECGQWINGDLYTGRIVKIGNSAAYKSPVFNYSKSFPFLWDELKIPIRFESDLQKCEDVLLEICTEVVGDFVNHGKLSWNTVLKDFYVIPTSLDPKVTIAFDHKWITLTIRYIVDYKSRRDTKSKIAKAFLVRATGSKDILIATRTLDVTLSK